LAKISILVSFPLNIGNWGSDGRGAQREVTPDLRRSLGWRERIACERALFKWGRQPEF